MSGGQPVVYLLCYCHTIDGSFMFLRLADRMCSPCVCVQVADPGLPAAAAAATTTLTKLTTAFTQANALVAHIKQVHLVVHSGYASTWWCLLHVKQRLPAAASLSTCLRASATAAFTTIHLNRQSICISSLTVFIRSTTTYVPS